MVVLQLLAALQVMKVHLRSRTCVWEHESRKDGSRQIL
jgi:hypothetical protein